MWTFYYFHFQTNTKWLYGVHGRTKDTRQQALHVKRHSAVCRMPLYAHLHLPWPVETKEITWSIYSCVFIQQAEINKTIIGNHNNGKLMMEWTKHSIFLITHIIHKHKKNIYVDFNLSILFVLLYICQFED